MCVALLQSFREQHSKKMVCARGEAGVTGILTQLKWVQGLHLHIKSAVNWCSWEFIAVDDEVLLRINAALSRKSKILIISLPYFLNHKAHL